MMEMKAEPFTSSQLDQWLAGKIPRRILVAPFGGPLSKARGLDLDKERFDDEPCGAPGCTGTDFYGPYPELKASRDRLVDFHHATFLGAETHPALEAVKGAIMGHVVLDEQFSEEDSGFAGLWGSFWANAGEKRRSLIRWLEEHAVPMYGSSQPVAGGVIRGKAGHLCVWPIRYHTISTSPQNTYAVVPPLKAALDAPDVTIESLRALAVDMDDLGSLLSPSATGDDGAKAGRVFSRRNQADIETELADLEAAIIRVRELLTTRQTVTVE
jgi:hypothetical protein